MQTPTSHLATALSNAALDTKIDPDIIEQLQHFEDHSALYYSAQRHGLRSLIYRAIDGFDLTPFIPDKYNKKFKRTYYRTLSKNLRGLKALEGLRQNLSPQIPLLVLKGPALIHSIYHNPALRPMTDIDLLVADPEHLSALNTCMYTLGYASPTQYPDIYCKDGVVFDIHTDPFHSDRILQRRLAVPINLADLWQDAIPFPDLSNLYMLNLSDQILTLSVHALKHGYERKIWLIDILHCVKLACQNGSWHHVEKRSEQYNTTRILALTLHAIQNLLNAKLPYPAHNLQKSFPIGAIRRKILCTSPQPGRFQILEPLVMSEQFPKRIDRLKYLIAFAFPTPKAMQQISGLSGRFRWLSYPYRIIQLIGLGTLQVFKLIYRLMGTRSQ
ncbi:MAG: nucleotidyltransferase family protein [Candidatus Latescibacteria bacterium]|jgi:hypothetical protein|nr:nucleotidyltransferase family protein [Candidatus Latescibacterota bacterium]MBT4139829.1 nucleotidyltransferase family protein [Candidatus Latescibacterota bacterium]